MTEKNDRGFNTTVFKLEARNKSLTKKVFESYNPDLHREKLQAIIHTIING